MTDPLTVKDEIQQALKRLTIATVVAYALLAATMLGGYGLSLHASAELRGVANRTNEALCTFRADLVRRVENAKAFLKEHPGGFGGITAYDLQRSIDNQQATINALRTLEC